MKPPVHRDLTLTTALLALLLFYTLMGPGTLTAEVVRVEVSSRDIVQDSDESGRFGPYEEIKGMI